MSKAKILVAAVVLTIPTAVYAVPQTTSDFDVQITMHAMTNEHVAELFDDVLSFPTKGHVELVAIPEACLGALAVETKGVALDLNLQSVSGTPDRSQVTIHLKPDGTSDLSVSTDGRFEVESDGQYIRIRCIAPVQEGQSGVLWVLLGCTGTLAAISVAMAVKRPLLANCGRSRASPVETPCVVQQKIEFLEEQEAIVGDPIRRFEIMKELKRLRVLIGSRSVPRQTVG